MIFMNITEISDADFEKTIYNNQKVIVDCYAPWCGSCNIFYPAFEELAENKRDTVFCKINTDENPGIAEKYNIMSIPTVLLFENGSLKNRQTAPKNKEDIIRMF